MKSAFLRLIKSNPGYARQRTAGSRVYLLLKYSGTPLIQQPTGHKNWRNQLVFRVRKMTARAFPQPVENGHNNQVAKLTSVQKAGSTVCCLIFPVRMETVCNAGQTTQNHLISEAVQKVVAFM